jgi:hypothetical protein
VNNIQTSKLLAILKGQYQHRFVIDDMTELVWMELLNQPPAIPYEAAKAAALAWMRDNEWPPQVKDIRDIIAETLCGIPGADAAWNHLQQWLKGSYPGIPNNLPPLPVLIVETVRELGGTSMIRNAEKPDAMREKFARAYDRRRREQMQITDMAAAWGDSGPAVDAGNVRALPRKAVS